MIVLAWFYTYQPCSKASNRQFRSWLNRVPGNPHEFLTSYASGNNWKA